MKIGTRMAIVRKSRELTIKQVADKLGNTTYDRIEVGKIDPKFGTILDICKILKIDIWELVADELIVKYTEKLKSHES